MISMLFFYWRLTTTLCVCVCVLFPLHGWVLWILKETLAILRTGRGRWSVDTPFVLKWKWDLPGKKYVWDTNSFSLHVPLWQKFQLFVTESLALWRTFWSWWICNGVFYKECWFHGGIITWSENGQFQSTIFHLGAINKICPPKTTIKKEVGSFFHDLGHILQLPIPSVLSVLWYCRQGQVSRPVLPPVCPIYSSLWYYLSFRIFFLRFCSDKIICMYSALERNGPLGFLFVFFLIMFT